MDTTSNTEDPALAAKLGETIKALEQQGELVIATAFPSRIVEPLHDAVRTLYSTSTLSSTELAGVRALILHAIENQTLFDWEMPTLTGFTADEFRQIADKLPTK